MFVAERISKRYGAVVAHESLSLAIRAGERVAVIGPSGGGKTTLLHLLAGLLPPDGAPAGGSVRVAGRDLARLQPGRELARLVGVMHQQYDLVPHLAVVHNVLAGRLSQWSLPRSLVSLVRPLEAERAFRALERVGLGQKLYERTARLSGGEQQRVALARLLVQDPRAIVADEPVSAVDPARADDLMRLLVGISAEGGRTLIASLHAVPLALAHFQRVVGLRAGRLRFDLPAEAVTAAHLEDLYLLDADTPGAPAAAVPVPA
jgi:phosphonate transport system ATP-binding protein